MARNEDGTYSQVGFIKDKYGNDITEYIYDKDGNIAFERGFTREVEGSLPLQINGIGKDLKEYSITGNTVQDGTPTPENPAEVLGCGVRTANLFDIKKATFGKFMAENREVVSSSAVHSDYIDVSPNETYWISNFISQPRFYTGCEYNANKEFIRYIDLPRNAVSGTITTSEEGKYIVLNTDNSLSDNSFIAKSSTEIPYEPYGYKIPVVTRGKNLFDYKTMYGIEKKYLNENGEVLNSSVWAVTDYIPCSGNVFTINPIGGNIPAICLYDSQKNYITGLSYGTGGANYKKPVTIRSEINASYIRFSYYINSDKDADDLSKIQIEIGDTATPYETYHEPITTPIYLPTPLYRGEVLRSDGSREVKWEKLVLTGNETWMLQSVNSYGIANFYIIVDIRFVKASTAFSSHFLAQKTLISQTTGEGVFLASDNTIYIRVKQEFASTAISFKSYLAEQYAAGTPVTVWYRLAEPTTETFTAPQIPTLNGTTVIDVNTAVKPTEMHVKCKSSK